MKRFMLMGLIFLFSTNLAFAQASKAVVGIKDFDINHGEALVKIKWDSGKLNYQLIYKKGPSLLEHYVRESFPRDDITKITFVDKDGFKVAERFCYVGNFTYDKDGQNLICRNSSDDDRKAFSIEEFRKISGASVLINQDPSN